MLPMIRSSVRYFSIVQKLECKSWVLFLNHIEEVSATEEEECLNKLWTRFKNLSRGCMQMNTNGT